MSMNESKKTIRKWLTERESLGQSTFSIADVEAEFRGLSNQAIRNSLQRLKVAKKISSPFRGFYVIVPISYVARGWMVPPMFYMTELMETLKRPYYFGLISAARLYGASHQLSQVDHVFTLLPQLNTGHSSSEVKWCYRSSYPKELVSQVKGENGMISVSSPELTMIDLVQYEQYCGGLSNVATIMAELVETVDFEQRGAYLSEYCKGSAIQRAGYILEEVLGCRETGEALHRVFKDNFIARNVKLSPRSATTGDTINKRWHVSINCEIEVDEL